MCQAEGVKKREKEKDPLLREDGEHMKKEEGPAGTLGGVMLLCKLCGFL